MRRLLNGRSPLMIFCGNNRNLVGVDTAARRTCVDTGYRVRFRHYYRKTDFGGLGCNFVNPALAARAFLLAAWPMHLTRDWLTPLTFDAATTATPLAVMQATARGTVPGLFDLLIGTGWVP